MVPHYITNAGAGAHDGSSLANAWTPAEHNAAATIAPGDIVWISDPLGSLLIPPTSGTLANPILYQFAPGGKLSAPFWTNGAINSSKSHLVIDGLSVGQIIATANGTARANQVGSIGINLSAGFDVTIQNLPILDQYVRTPGSADPNREGQGIVIASCTGSITVDNCTLKEGDTMISYVWDVSCSDLVIKNCTIGRCNHGINCGFTANNVAVNRVSFFKNSIKDFDVWSGSDLNHLDGIFLFDESPANVAGDWANAGRATNVKIYGNRIGPNIGVHNTGAIFIADQSWKSFAGHMIYNNILVANAGESWTNGAIVSGSNSAVVAHNTSTCEGNFINIGNNAGISALAMVIKNNLGYGIGTGIFAQNGGLFNSDYNIFAPIGGLSMYYPPGFYYNLPDWVAATGKDVHSTINIPTLDANFVPTAIDGVARNKGTNLASLGIVDDYYGTPRPQETAYDIGAGEFKPAGPIGTGSRVTGKLHQTGKVSRR